MVTNSGWLSVMVGDGGQRWQVMKRSDNGGRKSIITVRMNIMIIHVVYVCMYILIFETCEIYYILNSDLYELVTFVVQNIK